MEEILETIRRITEDIDTAWRSALRTGAPAGLVMTLDEASFGLHRAWIALSDSIETSRSVSHLPRNR